MGYLGAGLFASHSFKSAWRGHEGTSEWCIEGGREEPGREGAIDVYFIPKLSELLAPGKALRL